MQECIGHGLMRLVTSLLLIRSRSERGCPDEAERVGLLGHGTIDWRMIDAGTFVPIRIKAELSIMI